MGKEHTMVTGTQFKMNLFGEGYIPYKKKTDAEPGEVIPERDGTSVNSDAKKINSVDSPAANRLTVTPDIDYTELSEGQKDLWLRARVAAQQYPGRPDFSMAVIMFRVLT